MRVIFVAGDLSDGGGVNRVISELSALMAERLAYEVTILAVGTKGPPTYRPSDRVKLERGSDDRPIGWREALARVRRDKPDFVIGPWPQANLILILGLRLAGIRVIAVEHASWNFQPRWVRALRRLIYPLAWRVVVLNPSELRHYRRLDNVRLIPNPVRQPEALPSGSREKLIVAIGHLLPNKNFADAVEAMALSRLEDEGWQLAIIGAGPDETRLRDCIGRSGLERTRIHPPTSDLGSWYARASLMLVTSKLEVFSLVLAEGMSAGVVPIAYAADGPAFILEDFADHLVPVGALEALSERLRHFGSGQIPESLRADLRRSIGTRFSPATVTDKWHELLEEAPRR